MRKSVGQVPTAGEQTQQKPRRTSSDIGEEQENHTVGRGSTKDRKGLNCQNFKHRNKQYLYTLELFLVDKIFLH
jgi:hypothetical protein